MHYMKRKASGHKYEVSLVTAAYAVGGIAAAATTVAGLGAATMAAGSVLGIKEAKPIGGLMMAGGGIASGMSGLGMLGGAATATGALGTLSAGASLVGGALQGVGILTGNDQMANIGGLIGGAGMIGQSMTGASASISGGSSGDMIDLGSSNKMMSGAANKGGTALERSLAVDTPSWSTPGINPVASGGVGGTATTPNLIERIGKYDNYIKMAGDFASGMAQNSTKQDELALRQQEIDLMNRRSTAVAIPGALPVSAGTPQAVAPIVSNRSTGLLNTTSQQVPGVA